MDRSLANEEAQRWLGTAEKLLAARDLVGAKSFAIRVREAFPRLESAADEVVAVADTLIAGENKIGGSATGNHHHQHQNQQQQGLPDWYGVMSLPQFTQNVEAVANQYHRLAIILNPHRNRLPYADEAFRLATDAWSVLSNPSKKVFYDNQLAMYSRFDIAAGNQTQTESQSQAQTHHHHHQLQEHQFLQRNNNLQPHHHHQQQQHHHFYNQNPSPPPQQPQFQPSAQPFQPPRHQPQHQPLHQHQQYQHQQLQQQQTPNARRKNPRKGVALSVEEERPNLNNAAESSRSARPAAPSPSPSPPPPPPPPPTAAESAAAEKEQTPPQEHSSPEEPSFWTACPFCYILYEYPKLFEDYVLRCQNCKRAFTAGAVPAPPISDDGIHYFCCWGFFPLGYSSKSDGGGSGSGWTPFSPIFACPLQDEGNKKKGHQENNDNGKRKKLSSPRFIYRDEDIFVEISDESDSSDCDWRNTRQVNNKKSTTATPTKKNSGSKGKVRVRPSAENRTPPKSERVTRASNGSVEKVERAGRAPAVVVAVKAETSRKGKGAAGGGRKGKYGTEWGKLDLNVEFNNDVEDSAAVAAAAAAAAAGKGSGAGSGGGEEDNIEGISFFEGLDEFLSSLPILNVVGGDDKVKAT